MDWKKIGLKMGLEVHQQLDTGKLFCRCPSFLRTDKPDKIIHRKLHAVAGEEGEVDVAAMYEAEKEKEFIYEGYNDNCCLVDYDESPPREINQEALKIALQIAILLNCKIIPITQIMRKTVINGSNVSGFQRTLIFARDGWVETESGRVGIESVFLEEDAARIVGEEEGKKIFKLDRLGIPLVEIGTAPDIKSPEQAKEVALHIGEILRSCKVKRGIGTIREDINISIRGENRVEMKGVQDMKIFLKTVENEIKRQLRLSDSGKATEAEVRNALPEGSSEFLRPIPGKSRLYPETDLPLLKISRNLINEVKKSLPKLRGEVEEELKKTGLGQEMIKLLLKQNKVDEFKNLLGLYSGVNFVAKMILLFPKEISSKTKKSLNKIEKLLSDFYGDVLIALNKKKISESDVKDILIKIVSGEPIEKAIKVEKADIREIEEKIMKLIKDKPGLNVNAYMGLVMKDPEMKGKIDGKTAMGVIRKFAK